MTTDERVFSEGNEELPVIGLLYETLGEMGETELR